MLRAVNVGMLSKGVAFCLVSVALLVLSRTSLRRPRSHGFYRFFAWESILVLLLVSFENWFHEPTSPRQIASWISLTVSAVLAALSLFHLRRFGGVSEQRQDEALVAIERTAVLVTRGPYRWIRHPMYTSLMLLVWAMVLKQPDWVVILIGLAATVLLAATAQAEETENSRFFGSQYQDYSKRTKRFIPFVLSYL